MTKMLTLGTAALLATGVALSSAGGPADAFVDLFNGKDLAGWVNVNSNADTWAARGGEIVCSGRA